MKLPIPRNPIAIAGVFLATIGALFFAIFFLLDLFGLHSNPYMGIVFFLVLPSLFILGLLLIPIGLWQDRRKRRAGQSAALVWPRVDFNNPRHRNIGFLVAIATFVNVLIVSLAGGAVAAGREAHVDAGDLGRDWEVGLRDLAAPARCPGCGAGPG